MKKQMSKIAGFTLVLSLFFVACNKNDGSVSPTETAIDDNHTIVDASETVYQLSEDVVNLPFGGRADGSVLGDDKPWHGTFGCADVTKTVANGTVTIVYDFSKVKDGTCNGEKVGGKMTITHTVRPDNFTGVVARTVTFENFLRDGRTLNGTHNITTNFTNGAWTTSEKLGNMTIVTADGKTLTFTSTKTRTKIGNDTQVTGTTSGKSSDGKEFLANITKALLFKASCKATSGNFPVSGTTEIKPFDKDKRIVDFGDGTCDRQFTVTINGVTVTKIKG